MRQPKGPAPPIVDVLCTTQKTPERSFLPHPRIAQPDEIRGFEQGAGLGDAPLSAPQMGHARIAIVVDQPPGFREFRGGAFGVAVEAIDGGEGGVNVH